MAGQASHIVPVSNPLFIILRGVQIFLAVALLGILAYLGWAYSAVYGSFTSIYSGAIGVGLFTVCVTLIYGVYYLVTAMCAPAGYNRWAIIAFEAFLTLFWLISFAVIADCVALNVAASQYYSTYSTYTSGDGYDYGDCSAYDYTCYVKRSLGLQKRDSINPYEALFDTALALAIIEWILFIVTLVLFSISLHKHRRSNSQATTQSYTPKQMEAQSVPAPQYQEAPPQPGPENPPMH